MKRNHDDVSGQENDAFAFLIKFRSLILFCTLPILLILVFLGLGKITFDDGYRVFFDETDPFLVNLEDFEAEYQKTEDLFFLIIPNSGSVFTPDHLGEIRGLTEGLWQVPYSVRVESIANYQHTYSDDEILYVGDLIPEIIPTDEVALSDLRATSLGEKNLVGRLLSNKAHASAIQVTLNIPEDGDEDETRSEIHDFVDTFLVEELSAIDAEVHVLGMVARKRALADASASDTRTLYPLMLIVALVFLLIQLRSLLIVFLTFSTVLISIVFALGLAGFFGIALNIVTIITPLIVLALSVAALMHYCYAYIRINWEIDDGRQAARDALRATAVPITLSAVTTTVGFLAINFSDSPAFRSLGNIVAIGVLTILYLAIFVLPLLFERLKPKRRRPAFADIGFTAQLSNFVIKKFKLILSCGLIAMVVSIFGIMQNRISDDIIEYFNEDMVIRQAADAVSDNLTGIDAAEFVFNSGEENGVHNPIFLTEVQSFVDWAKANEKVAHAFSYTETLKGIHKNMAGDAALLTPLPDDSDLAAQYLLIYEMSLPAGQKIDNQISYDRSSLRVTLSLKNMDALDLVEFNEAALDWAAMNVKSSKVSGVSETLMFATIGQRNIVSMAKGTLFALIFITVLICISLRSLRYGLISVLPNVVPMMIAFGIWGVMVGKLNLAGASVAVITLGIVVDDTVHFMHGYVNERRKGSSAEHAISLSFIKIGPPLVMTTVVLSLSFGVLAYSNFAFNSQMGLLSALTITAALIYDLLVLPSLLRLVDGKTEMILNTENCH